MEKIDWIEEITARGRPDGTFALSAVMVNAWRTEEGRIVGDTRGPVDIDRETLRRELGEEAADLLAASHAAGERAEVAERDRDAARVRIGELEENAAEQTRTIAEQAALLKEARETIAARDAEIEQHRAEASALRGKIGQFEAKLKKAGVEAEAEG